MVLVVVLVVVVVAASSWGSLNEFITIRVSCSGLNRTVLPGVWDISYKNFSSANPSSVVTSSGFCVAPLRLNRRGGAKVQYLAV